MLLSQNMDDDEEARARLFYVERRRTSIEVFRAEELVEGLSRLVRLIKTAAHGSWPNS